MTFWSGDTLGERLPNLISPFDPGRIDCAAYRLRVGPEAYVSPSSAKPDAGAHTKMLLAAGEGLAVPPGQFGFLVTEEVVRVPADVLGFISIRARVKSRGLVNVSGFHVDPGYQGRLIFAVFNAGPAPVNLARGDDCFLIWFANLDRASRSVKVGTGFSGIPSDLINPIAGEIQSFAGLLAKMETTKKELEGRLGRVERDHTIVRWGVTLLVAAALSWFFRDHLPSAAGLRSSAPATAASTQASGSPAP